MHPATSGAEIHGGQSYKRIEAIVAGDRVLAWGEQTGGLSWRPVTQTFVRKADAIYKLTYADGTVVETTWSHPFYSARRRKPPLRMRAGCAPPFGASEDMDVRRYIEGRGWVKAKDLAVGDLSYTAPYVRMMARAKRPAMTPASHSVNEARTVRVAEDPMSGSVSASGNGIVSVEVVAQRLGPETVYNFEVETDHTYFVASAEVLVHNPPGSYPLPGRSAAGVSGIEALLCRFLSCKYDKPSTFGLYGSQEAMMADVRMRAQTINNVDYVNEMIEVYKGTTATNSEYLDPDEMVRTACVVNSVYYYLKMEGKDPGSFVDFYIRTINAGAATIKDGDTDTRANTAKMLAAFGLERQKANSLRAMDAAPTSQGYVSLSPPSGRSAGHTVAVYRDPKGVWRVAGTSTAGKGIEQRGKTVRDIMELEGRSFQSFYYGTPKSKR